jgi:Peptidase family M41/ATPase family associated with various cellular activities (AAA)
MMPEGIMKIDREQLKQRQQKIEETRTALKKYFIGIDNIIDDLLDYIQIWYLMPEILNRPIIVNLWGMTGVGKTDLIRRLVKLLDFQDRFLEVELSNVDNTNYYSSVASYFENYEMNDNKPAIVLFDEIQRFNTIDTEGKPLESTKFTDFWELLSDGRLSKKERSDLDWYISDFITSNKYAQQRKQKGEENIEEDPTLGLYEAKELRKMLNLDKSLTDMADMKRSEMLKIIMQEKKKKKIYEPVDHSQTLIIVSGNLDEAFEMANLTSEADVDADIFHSYTKKVTIVDVKNALSRKFRPEQVARFGNIHLIYTSLRKSDFELIIVREIERIISNSKERFDIELTIDRSINELIYRNGVFPVQGVRPVFSSVIDILEANLSKFVFTALTTHATKIVIQYNETEAKIIAEIDTETIAIPYVGRIDKIREGNLQDAVANISVHEAGHAVIYMLLMGLAPLQLKSKVASSYASGFTFPHQIHETKENLIKKIKIYLAGGIAEEIMFGQSYASIGRIHDREQATSFAIDYVRKYGFDDEFQANYTLEYAYVMDKSVTDLDVEKMLTRLALETQEQLSARRELLKRLSIELCVKGSLDATEIAAIAAKFGLNALVKEEGFLKIHDYHKALQEGIERP